MKKNVLAIDLGASSGRAIIGSYHNGVLSLEEIHRFSNDPLEENGTLYWNFPYLLEQVQVAIKKATKTYPIDSLGINTWGVDYGLLDEQGQLIENPIHYRDVRTRGTIEEVTKLISEAELYQMTGNQLMEINTIFQLWATQKNEPLKLNKATTLLMMPDLLNYFLTGTKKTEMSIASTTQLFNPLTKDWNGSLIKKLNLPQRLFTEIVREGNVLGTITSAFKCPPIPLYNICSHDTASAVVSLPTQERSLFISCGTWSLVGIELYVRHDFFRNLILIC